MESHPHEEADTIAAISTPLGEGGIGVVRLSGPAAYGILSALFTSNEPLKIGEIESHRVYHGTITDPKTAKPIDEALVVFMKAPKSYTGEDVVEMSCHGGAAVLQRALQAAVLKGARLAQRGEFTKRAFLNGKMDLAQAEAVISLIKAKTTEGAEVAAFQLFGGLSANIRKARERLLILLAGIEAGIDFPDDVSGAGEGEWGVGIGNIKGNIDSLLKTADAGLILKAGIPAAIIGRPNVGKSCLLNALLRGERAIVSETPGTTRDTIEEVANIKGLPVLMIDTAGIRHASGNIERLGVERTTGAINKASLALVVFDASEALSDEDKAVANKVDGKKAIAVLNKIDKANKITPREIKTLLPNAPLFKVSALFGNGIPELEEGIFQTLLGESQSTDGPVVISMRQKECLIRASEALARTKEGLSGGAEEAIIAIDLREALAALGEVTGESVSDEIIEKVFSEFCVGK